MIDDTIFALASGAPPAAIAVVRISGRESLAILSALLGDGVAPPEARRVGLRRLFGQPDRTLLDEALVVCFEPGASFTGEAVVELQTHGGPAVVDALETSLIALGARPARPGEFTRRALAHGRLDLARAEAVGALVAAESEDMRRQALRVLDGAVGVLVEAWRAQAVAAAALLETGIDFADEALGQDLIDRASQELAKLAHELRRHAEEAFAVDLNQEAAPLVLVGPPNAGKSSLMNAITGRDLSIVAATPGTTRDAVRSGLRIHGHRLELIDTAGLRDAPEAIEQAGVERTRRLAESAWRRVYVLSGDTAAAGLECLAALPPRAGDLALWTKSDLDPHPPETLRRALGPAGGALACVNARDGTARAALVGLLGRDRQRSEIRSPIVGSARRAGLVARAADAVERAQRHAERDAVELAAMELRSGLAEIEALIGAVDHEDILDALFATFCIGK